MSNPFKFKSSSEKFSGRFKSIFKVFFIVFGILISLAILLEVLYQNKKDGDLNGKYDYVEYVKKAESIPTINSDGTMNGINLLLISSLNDSFIKDYLTTCQKNTIGAYNDNKGHVSVDGIIALNMAEQGSYDSSPIPCTYFPWDSANQKVIWNQSINGLPAEALTFEKANRQVFGGNNGSGPVTPYKKADDVAPDPANGGTASPFQIGRKWMNLMEPSKINGYNETSSRTSDITYFPDQLKYIDGIRDGVLNSYFNVDDLEPEDATALAIMFFALGEGNACRMEFSGITGTGSDSKEKRLSSWNEYKETMDRVDKKYGASLAKYSYDTLDFHRIVNIAMSMAAVDTGGWKFEDDYKIGELLSEGLVSYQILYPGASQSDFESFVNSNKRSSGGFYLNRTAPCRINREGDSYSSNSDNISFGHTFMALYMGKYYYAYLLQMGGLADVDPTNPSTYMNKLQEGEWLPSGETDWLKEVGIELNSLNSNRIKLLNEGHSVLGAPYIWAGTTWPVFDGSNWSGGLDCSGFTQQTTQRSLAISISRSTYSQIDNENLEPVEPDQARPGDLVYHFNSRNDNHHVVFFLKNNGDGTILALHSPSTGDVVKVADYPEGRGRFAYRRIKGIDD